MKTTLLLLALVSLTALAPAVEKDDKKPDRKSRAEKKDDKKEVKEAVRNLFSVVVDGAKDEAAESDLKAYLSSIEGATLDKSEKTSKGIEAVLSSAGKLSRSDVSKALKDNKDLKVTEFKALRPARDKDEKKPDDKKVDDKKPDEKKPVAKDDKKPEAKPAEVKPEAKPEAAPKLA